MVYKTPDQNKYNISSEDPVPFQHTHWDYMKSTEIRDHTNPEYFSTNLYKSWSPDSLAREPDPCVTPLRFDERVSELRIRSIRKWLRFRRLRRQPLSKAKN